MTAPVPIDARGLAGWVDADAPPQDLIARCVHCGFCLPTCPTYAVLGLEQDSPRGRIRLMKGVWDGRLDARADALDSHIYRCLDCRACETACPSGVEFGKLVEATRSQLEGARPRPLGQRILRWIAFRAVLPRPRLIALLARAGYVAKRLGAERVLRAVPLGGRLGSLLALLPDRPPSAAPLEARYEAAGARRMRVALFQGCVMRGAFADTNAATARVLARNGVEVLVPERQTCCGALHVHAGEPDGGRDLARRNIAALEDLDVDAIVVNAAGCGANLKEYGWLLRGDPRWRERAERFAARVKDAVELLGDIGLAARPGPLTATVTWDDPCHLLHGQKVKEQPRALLQAIPGLTVVPLSEADWCCGSAGVYNVTQPALSADLLRRKVGHIERTGAEIVVTANPGCLMQIDAGLRQAGSRARVMHLIDLLDRAYATR
ncbi:MAG TPA: glycolate oxidase subunit GlcF [Candidatus Limnocylindria bacterium]|nr:glycolate oxidase subunit GlcF [Candidatus Limnocylindria bacterium]